MTTTNTGLTFDELRRGNIARIPEFQNAKGKIEDYRKWKLSQWSNAMFGECGEAANVIKKIERGDYTLAAGRQILADELADIQTYLDLLAWAANIDLGQATISKFNLKSEEVGSVVQLHNTVVTTYTGLTPDTDKIEKVAKAIVAIKAVEGN